MTKKLNIGSITNELAGSAFFRPNTQPVKPEETLPTSPLEKPAIPERQEIDLTQTTPPVPVPERVPVGVRVGVPPPVPLIPKVKRVIKQRQPFDIYEDQYQRLKKIADEEKDFENGRGMSQMVRIAIDNYLKDHGTPQE
jgi:hypothetical protein